MRIDALKLHSFRNYDALDVEFAPDCNVIVGENAQAHVRRARGRNAS